MSRKPEEYFLKRPLDYILALSGLVTSLALWLVICVLIWLEDGKPFFYFQERVGKNGKIFKIKKFRSMVKNAEKDTGAVLADENDPRITRFGKIIRATAMDELPQLLSIIKGDMSFVGPRPERPELVKSFEKETKAYSQRHSVRPGLTGLAQVFGRYDSPASYKLEYDLRYIEKRSLSLEIHVILVCFWITFKAKWSSQQMRF